jgi:hypothetical protein
MRRNPSLALVQASIELQEQVEEEEQGVSLHRFPRNLHTIQEKSLLLLSLVFWILCPGLRTIFVSCLCRFTGQTDPKNDQKRFSNDKKQPKTIFQRQKTTKNDFPTTKNNQKRFSNDKNNQKRFPTTKKDGRISH